jgi:hypothetical protein|tara:strand:+ start:263 stop:460 length:198 start_codon:yes stop_codon:yes gene_type:complete
MTKVMSEENLKKFIKKYQDIENNAKWGIITIMDDDNALWKQGADDLMKALKIDIEYLQKYNELND